jgi:hypothetical protein
MPSIRRPHWLGRLWSAARPGKGRPPRFQARPCLEVLEDRTAPTAFLQPTTTVINPISTSSFGFTTQVETVKVQTTIAATGAPVNEGLVTITDGGLIQTVPVNAQGLATATFTFGLLQGQEQPRPHTVTASYVDQNSLFAPSAAGAQAPDNTAAYNFQITLDLAFLVALGL